MGKKHYVVIPEKGPPCHRCGEATQIRVHDELTYKHLKIQPFYYSRWYNCANKECRTTLIMPQEFCVYRDPEEERLRQIKYQLGEM